MPRLPDGTPIRALLLDLDDTLLDNRSGVGAAWDAAAAFLAETLSGLDAARLRAEIAGASEWFWSDPERLRRGRLDLVAARRAVFARALAALGREAPEAVADAVQGYQVRRDADLCLEEGALALLARLRARVPRLALVTNGASDAQRAKIERFALARFFDHVQIEGEFGAGKPERRVFEHALCSLGVGPAAALMAGDDFACDVLGSLGAGLHAAWIDCHARGAPPAAAPRGFHTLRSLQDLASLLGV